MRAFEENESFCRRTSCHLAPRAPLISLCFWDRPAQKDVFTFGCLAASRANKSTIDWLLHLWRHQRIEGQTPEWCPPPTGRRQLGAANQGSASATKTNVEHQAPRERGRPCRERKRSWTLLANFSWLRSQAHIPALAQHHLCCRLQRAPCRTASARLETMFSVGVGVRWHSLLFRWSGRCVMFTSPVLAPIPERPR